MKTRVTFHRKVKQELSDAASYYNSENPGLGGSFLNEIDRCLESIVTSPEAGPVVSGPVRRRLTRRFPYALLYSVKPSHIRVLAVMHLKRRPMYWLGRQ